MLHFNVECCINWLRASLTAAVALMGYKNTYTSVPLVWTFSAISGSRIEFVGQNFADGWRTSVSGISKLTPPWETIQLWIVFKGQATLIFLHFSGGKSLQFCKTCSQSNHVWMCLLGVEIKGESYTMEEWGGRPLSWLREVCRGKENSCRFDMQLLSETLYT